METDATADGSQSGNIYIARFDLKKGEQTAHACGNS
jgi:hypothetical protein